MLKFINRSVSNLKSIILKNVNKVYHKNVITGGIKSYFKSLINRKKQVITAVKDISFEVNQGEIIGLLGENGAGKSTLIKMMDGILSCNSGSVEVLGYNPFKKDVNFLKKIGVVMGQKNQLWWDLSPRETFLLYKSIYGLSNAEFEDSLQELVSTLHVENVIDTPTRNLSLGERMKCELICSLIHRPEILFLDEPTIGLDFIAQKDIRKFILNYRTQRKNTTIILTSHYMADIEELADRIIVLNNGEKVYDGDFLDLKKLADHVVYLNVQSFDKNIDCSSIDSNVIEKSPYEVVLKIKPGEVESCLNILNKHNKVKGFSFKEMSVQDLLEQIYVNGELK